MFANFSMYYNESGVFSKEGDLFSAFSQGPLRVQCNRSREGPEIFIF